MKPPTKKILIGLVAVYAVGLLSMKGYGYYLDTEIERLNEEIAALHTDVSVHCGWHAGVVRVTVKMPTEYVSGLDGQGLLDLNDEICDVARESLNKTLNGESNE